MTAFERAWALLKEEPFFECQYCPNKGGEESYHYRGDGSTGIVFCRDCGTYHTADMDGNWKIHDIDGDLSGLVKAPYHGTGAWNAKQIMRGGLRPQTHPWFRNNPDYPDRVSFGSRGPTYAGEFAQVRSDKGGPAIIHISDEMPTIMDEEGAKSVVYGETIPPEMMEIVYQGRAISPGEDEDDYQAWVQNDIQEWLLARDANPSLWQRGDDE